VNGRRSNARRAVDQGLWRQPAALVARFNRSGDATMVVPSEYLEIVVTKR
jgi:hypothetical protein